MTCLTLVLLALVQSVGSPPPQVPPPVQADPARLVFEVADPGLVLVPVKTDKVADYEAVISGIHQALATLDASQRAFAAGWRVFKAAELDAKGNTLYVHVIARPDPTVDYRPSLVLDRLVATLAEDVLVKYRDALAAAPSRLSLALLADLSLAPVPKPER